MLTKFIFAWALNWLPLVISGLIILVILLNNLLPNLKCLIWLKKLSTEKLTYILVGLTALFNSLLSVLQYVTWHSSAFSRFFLPPYIPISYFIRYIFVHFWLASILVFLFTLAFYLIFILVRRRNREAISKEELHLILLSGLLVGWPNFIIFVPTFFLLALIFSIINLLVFKNKKNTLLYPLILSLSLIFLGGHFLINYLGLSAFVI
jgi:hypothetical protein